MQALPVFFSKDRINFEKHANESVAPSAHWVQTARALNTNFGWISYEETSCVGAWHVRHCSVRKYVARYASYYKGRYQGLRDIGRYKTLEGAVKSTQKRLQEIASINA
jgi:hypothetical protein